MNMKSLSKLFQMTLFLLVVSISAHCSAASLPETEFMLGDIHIGADEEYVVGIYGPPTQRVIGSQGQLAYLMYGDAFRLDFYDGVVYSMVVSQANGIGTPSGIRVGIPMSSVFDKFGYGAIVSNGARTFYANNGKKRMWITTDNRARIREIKVQG
ncbi:hypothetical protein [Selenomonas sp. AB3002]|uniref:hypothetical protein n=1 Tax=Selenomonas sp. AB3002 TaxID=1392502 RepID=UPI00049719A2